MRADSTLFRFLSKFLSTLPPRLLKTVESILEAIAQGQNLTLTGIGRNLPGRIRVKHKIKRVYRLLSNPTLHHAFNDLFAAIAAMLLEPDSRPILLVDWTCFDNQHYALVVSIPHEGRSLPIYLEVHPICDYATAEVEQAFLDTLNQHILPVGCRPVLISDAGFRNPWFDTVRRLGWDFVGRLCGNVTLQPIDATTEVWVERKVLFTHASATPTELGLYRCAKTNPLTARLVTVHARTPRMPSQKRSATRKKGSHGEKYRKQAQEPWLLITSLHAIVFNATAIVGLYSLRMQIEETFRDDKNRDSGVGLDASRSTTPEHLRALRWLGALHTVLTHTVGQVGERLGLHRHYQSNTTSDRRVLSLPFLGRQILQHEDRRRLSMKRLMAALDQIRTGVDVSRFVSTPKEKEVSRESRSVAA